jgi:hypothetical protein
MSLTYDAAAPYDEPFAYDGGGGPAPPTCYQYFITPTTLVNPPYLPDTPVGPALSLFRHYTPRALGVNVFLLSDGTYVQDYATETNQNTNVPYPWDPYNLPPTPFARVYDFQGNETDFNVDPYIVQVYYGGHVNPITCPESDSLLAAGYGPYLTNNPEDTGLTYRNPQTYRSAFTYQGQPT